MGKKYHNHFQFNLSLDSWEAGRLARCFAVAEAPAGHGIGIDHEVDKFSDELLEEELTNRYATLGFAGDELSQTVQRDFHRISGARRRLNESMLPFEQNRVPVNTIEYEWHQDETGEMHLWYPATEEYVYKMYENARKYEQAKGKKGIYNPAEHEAFLEIERSLWEKKATSAIAGVHDKTQLTRYVQQFYADGDTVKMSYIDVGLFRRDLTADEGKDLISSFAYKEKGRVLHGDQKDGFVYVLSTSGPVDATTVRLTAAAKVFVSDSLAAKHLTKFTQILRHPVVSVDEYKSVPEDWRRLSVHHERDAVEEQWHVPAVPREVAVPAMAFGQWLSEQNGTTEAVSAERTPSFIDWMIKTLRPQEFMEYDSEAAVPGQKEMTDVEIKPVTDQVESEKKQKQKQQSQEYTYITPSEITAVAQIVEQAVKKPAIIEERLTKVAQLVQEAVLTAPEFPALSVIALQAMSEGTDRIFEHSMAENPVNEPELIIPLVAVVMDHAPLVQERLEETKAQIEIIHLAVEEPAFIVAALGALQLIQEPLILSSEDSTVHNVEPTATSVTKEQPLPEQPLSELSTEEKQDQLLEILMRLAVILNTLSEQEKEEKIIIQTPHETPFSRSTKLSIEMAESDAETEASGIVAPPELQETRDLIQFSLALGLLMLFSEQGHTTMEKSTMITPEFPVPAIEKREINNHPSDTEGEQSNEVVPSDTFCLLMAIIYYLDQIKEQGIITPVPTNQKTKKVQKRRHFPRTAVVYVYMLSLAYD